MRARGDEELPWHRHARPDFVCSAGFLEVEPTDKVAVVDALGYWIEDAARAPQDQGLSASMPRLPSDDRLGESMTKGVGALTAKERGAVLEAINTALAQQQNENMMPGTHCRQRVYVCVSCVCVGWISGIPPIKTLLESVRTSTTEEKHDWLHRGVLDPLITVVCQNGHNILNNKTIIDVRLHLYRILLVFLSTHLTHY